MISETTSDVTVAGDNSTKSFNFTMTVPSTSVLQVIYTNGDSVSILDPALYNISLTPPTGTDLWSTGGVLTYPLSGDAIPLGSTLKVQRSIPYLQDVKVRNQGASYPVETEKALDKLSMQIQQVYSLANGDSYNDIVTIANSVTDLAAQASTSADTASSAATTAVSAAADAQAAADSITISTAMQPVVFADTTAEALTALDAYSKSEILSGLVWPLVAEGRLTISSGVPVYTGSGSSTTIYYTPYIGNRISVYGAWGAWIYAYFTEKSIAVPATTNTLYDVFAYWDGTGSVSVELTAWASTTARAVSLTSVDGVLVKSTDYTRRYLGTVMTGAVSGTVYMTGNIVGVWNKYNQVAKEIYLSNSTSHTYSSSTRRPWNNDATINISCICGEIGCGYINLSRGITTNNSSANVAVFNEFGVNSTSTAYAYQSATRHNQQVASIDAATQCSMKIQLPAIGLNIIYPLESNGASGTQTWQSTIIQGVYMS